MQILKSFIDIAEQTGRMVQMAVGVDGLAYSKRQLSFLSFLRERDDKATNQSNEDGHFSSWGNEKNSFRGNEINYKNGFNLNMFQPAGEGTPSSVASKRDKFDESTILRKAVRDIKRIADKERVSGIVVHSNPMHINAIGKR